MSTRAGKKPAADAQVTTPMVIGAVALLVIIIVGLGYYFLGSHNSRVAPRPATARESWIAQKSRESQGNFNALSPEDRQKAIRDYGQSAPMQILLAFERSKHKHG